MNQILNSDPNLSNKNFKNIPQNNNNNNNKYGNNGNTDKIIRIFAICMIVFAGALISTGVYSYMSNQDYSQTEQKVSEASAEIFAEEVNGKVSIQVSNKKDIDQLVFSWNGQKENKVQGEGKTLEKMIDLPAGNNTLIIAVIDKDGVVTNFEKSFESEDGVDIINPEIDFDVEGSKLNIIATDETALDFITYRWNDEEETKVSADENEKEINQKIEIMKGKNDITIVAVDKNNNTTIKTKTIKGLKKPEILIVSSADGSYLDITCKHDEGIKKVEYTLNDQKYEGVFEDSPNTVQFTQDLDIGYNRIILTATSVEDTTDTFDGNTEYYPDGYDASQDEEDDDDEPANDTRVTEEDTNEE